MRDVKLNVHGRTSGAVYSRDRLGRVLFNYTEKQALQTQSPQQSATPDPCQLQPGYSMVLSAVAPPSPTPHGGTHLALNLYLHFRSTCSLFVTPTTRTVGLINIEAPWNVLELADACFDFGNQIRSMNLAARSSTMHYAYWVHMFGPLSDYDEPKLRALQDFDDLGCRLPAFAH